MANPLDPMIGALNQADSLPFLFVGSGISRRYLGHENWQELLEWASSLTGRPYAYFAGQASGDHAATASLIAEAFYEIWWSDSKYRRSRDDWGHQCRNIMSPMKIEVARRLSASKPIKTGARASELRLFGSCQVDGIITTNYDALLETVFPDYRVFVGQEDLLLSRSYQLAEIYKIHGSVAEPESLVLCKEDYDRFEAVSPYLVAKLMSVFVEHPVVFLGYSLGDPNVRLILTSLLRCLSPERLETFKSRFVWVDWDPRRKTPLVDDHILDLGEGRLLPVVRVRTPQFKPIFEVLAGLERVLPVGILRRVEESVVRIVHSADPTRQIRVAEIADLNDFSDSDVVVGVGAESTKAWQGPKSYLGFDRHDLIADTVTDEGDFLADEIVRTTLPSILRRSPNAWVPVRKYVRRAGLPDGQVPESVRRAMAREPVGNYSVPLGVEKLPLAQLVEEHGLTKALNLICSMDRSMVNPSELRQLLVDHLEELSGDDANLGTAFGKATVLYDILANEAHAYDRSDQRPPSGSRTTSARTAARRKGVTKARQPGSVFDPPASAVRAWAKAQGLKVEDRGPISETLRSEYRHQQRQLGRRVKRALD